AGDMVPADVWLLSAKDLFVSQAMLTGESVPLEKYPVLPSNSKPGAHDRSALDLETACFMGTNVVSGAGMAVVVTTGNATYFGALARDIGGAFFFQAEDGIRNWSVTGVQTCALPI